jgi:hypothetical protein
VRKVRLTVSAAAVSDTDADVVVWDSSSEVDVCSATVSLEDSAADDADAEVVVSAAVGVGAASVVGSAGTSVVSGAGGAVVSGAGGAVVSAGGADSELGSTAGGA